MKKLTMLFVVLLMSVLATNKAFAQDDDDFFKTFDGAWDFKQVEIDKITKVDAQKTTKVMEELNKKYAYGLLNLLINEKEFTFVQSKTIEGKISFQDEDIILTKEEGKVMLRGKIYEFNEGKNMGISYAEKGVKVNLIFEKKK